MDKINHDHWNPLHPEAVAILKRERTRLPRIGDGPIFPDLRPKQTAQPMTLYASVSLWRRIAQKAKLPEGERYGWHSCRRAFANRLRKAPLRELQDLGGWKRAETVLSVYLRPDEAAQREVLTGDTGANLLPLAEGQSK